jgi:hypothetical protein
VVTSYHYFIPVVVAQLHQGSFLQRKEVEEMLALGEKYSQGHDVNIKFFISMDVLQHTNETITNSKQSSFFPSFPSYTICSCHCTM